MTENTSINSVSEFIDKISKLNLNSLHHRSPTVNALTFYRGQSDYEWGFSPKLYREKLLDKENVLIAELLRVAPKHFQQMKYFDMLVKMQHYGLPTRLLDMTLNPLIALFFACYGDNYKLKDGSIIVFPNLPVFRQEHVDITLIMKYIFEYSGFPLNIVKFLKDVKSTRELNSPHSIGFDTVRDILNTLVDSSFYPVLPTLSNTRIQNQDGAFLLFGMTVKKIERHETENNIYTQNYEFDILEFDNKAYSIKHGSKIFHVPSDKKEVILEELECIGITRSKMFPELEYQAEFVTNLVKKEFGT